MEERTKKSNTHMHTSILYEDFIKSTDLALIHLFFTSLT